MIPDPDSISIKLLRIQYVLGHYLHEGMIPRSFKTTSFGWLAQLG